MDSNRPPKVLVMTWLELLKESDDDDVIEHATNMLIGAFVSMQGVADYLSKNDITV
jgi:hypothetical protein